jgi:bifunctional non-homologous end joining protein LigD
VRFVSRNRTVFNNDYPELVDALKLLTAKSAIVDGEITALDQNGKSSFQLLQSYGKTKQTPLVYYAFDLLFLDGTDLRSRPLGERRKLLKPRTIFGFLRICGALETRSCEWRVSSDWRD